MTQGDNLKVNWWMVATTSLLTIILAVGIAMFFGMFGEITGNQSESDLKIKGNKASRIYHLPRCPNYDDIAAQNIVWFKTHSEARDNNFVLAQNCFDNQDFSRKNPTTNGELVSPSLEMQNAVKNYLAKDREKFVGMSARRFPNQEYLVTVDYEYQFENTWKPSSKMLIAQQACVDGKT